MMVIRFMLKSLSFVALLLSLGLVSAMPAHAADAKFSDLETQESCEIRDPLEPFNRAVYKFNDVLDRAILKPTAKAYRFVMPAWGRQRVHNFLQNLTSPVSFVNAVLQGDFHQSMITFWRFVINSTWGVGGLFDIAGQEGLVERKEDFGQTLGTYGVGSGPYIVWPIFGPSSLRDTGGTVVDIFTDPINYLDDDKIVIGRKVAEVVDSRERLLDLTDDIDRVSLDPYATVRSFYAQRRQSEVENRRYRAHVE